MKILIISDIHSNWPALAAIDEKFDVCLCIGDIVDYGVDPVPCVEWVRQRAAVIVRGNHDHAVAQRIVARPGSGLRCLTAATRPLHWEMLGDSQLGYLARLPVTRHFQLDGLSFFMVHATPRDPLDEYLAADPDAWEERLGELKADFVLTGHTHSQYRLTLSNGTQVVNPGSVGQPRDGDPRAAYAVIEKGRVELRRVDYDIDATLARMKAVGIAGQELELSEALLRSGSSYHPRLTSRPAP